MKINKGFTLIELLIVIAIVGILAAAILVAINPGKRMAQARDAQRKNDISAIANALIGYYALIGNYPGENACDSSVGRASTLNCPPDPLTTDWWQDSSDFWRIYQTLVTGQGFLKSLPKDPLNNQNYFYRYEPSLNNGSSPPGQNEINARAPYYWIGAMLEEPTDSSKPVFRCSDMTLLADGPGCKEVPGDIYASNQQK